MSLRTKENLKRGAIATTILVSIGTIMVGWLFLGVKTATDKADASQAQTANLSAQVSGLEEKVKATKESVDEFKVDTKKDLENMNNKLNILLSR